MTNSENHTSKRLLFRVAGQPQGKARPRYTKKGRAYTPKQTKAYEMEVKTVALKAAILQGWTKNDAPILIQISAYFAIPQSWSKKKQEKALAGDVYPTVKPDADNIAKIVCDALNNIAYDDDKQIVDCQVIKRYCYNDDDNPHITVCVEPMPTFSEMKAKALANQEAV